MKYCTSYLIITTIIAARNIESTLNMLKLRKFQTHSKNLDLRMYHYIRGESFLKLYVLFNMLAAWWTIG